MGEVVVALLRERVTGPACAAIERVLGAIAVWYVGEKRKVMYVAKVVVMVGSDKSDQPFEQEYSKRWITEDGEGVSRKRRERRV